MIVILALSAVIAGLMTAAFIILVAGIRQTDRRMSLRGPSRNQADAFARKMTGAYSHQSTDLQSGPRR